MGLAKLMVFLLLKILSNIVSMKYFLNVNNYWHFFSKILKNLQHDPNFIFDLLSESRIGFVSFLVFLALENVVSFTKTRFYRKQSSVTMHNFVETFHTNIDHNLI